MITETRPLSNAPARSKWKQIFVLSLPRSGSTLLRLILDTHPEICCPGELGLGQLCDDLYRALYFSLGQTGTKDDAARVAITTARVRETVCDFMDSYAASKHKSLWAEKTPSNLDHADRLAETFPDAAYICLHRNLLDLIRSGWEMTRYGKMGYGKFKYELWDHQEFLSLCTRQTRALMDFERKHRDRTIRIHYEQLTRNPTQALSRLFGFVGLDWNPSLIDEVFSKQHDEGPGDPKAEFANKVYTTSIGRGTSREVLSELEKAPKSLQDDLSALLSELGYPNLDAARSEVACKSERGEIQPAQTAPRFSDIDELFTHHFLARLNREPAAAADLKGAVKFIVRGAGGGTWTINLDAHPPALQAADRDADCTITIKADDLLELAMGKLNVGECYLQARLRVVGNEALAISLGRTLFARASI